MSPPAASYRPLFFAAVAVAAAAVGVACVSLSRAREAAELLARPRPADPRVLSEQRDGHYPFTVETYGYVYKGTTGNVIDDFILVYGAYEKDSLFFMRDYLRRSGQTGSAVLDVGANTGQHALFLSRHARHVHAFEPYPPVAERFRDMIRLNQFDNITLHEVGLGDREAVLPFLKPTESNQGGGTFRLEAQDVEDRELYGQLKIVPGDDWLESLDVPHVGLVKIDIEGYEEKALMGLRRTLERHRPLVVVEVSLPPVGTITTLEQLRGLFPEGYDFLYLVHTFDSYLTGRYELRPFAPAARELFAKGPQMDVVAYPRERAGDVPRHGPAAGKP